MTLTASYRESIGPVNLHIFIWLPGAERIVSTLCSSVADILSTTYDKVSGNKSQVAVSYLSVKTTYDSKTFRLIE
jgi:hypothetical protein